MVDDAIPMIRRRIERVQLHGYSPGVDDVVICSSRDEYREARSDRRPNPIENCLTGTLLHAKELVELVDFRRRHSMVSALSSGSRCEGQAGATHENTRILRA